TILSPHSLSTTAPSLVSPQLRIRPLLFFFYSYRAHLDLHSFPTRRSSDLSARGAPTRRAPRSIPTCRRSAPSARGRPCSRRARRDRKSTRLNSSHQIISYAVFCLKKKKNTHYIHYTHKMTHYSVNVTVSPS